MRSHALTLGRTFGVVFGHGEDFMSSLAAFCQTEGVRQGYVPGFLGAFSSADLVATCEAPADPVAPVWTRMQVEHLEAIGCATLAWDPRAGRVMPHVHLATGIKRYAAAGRPRRSPGAGAKIRTLRAIMQRGTGDLPGGRGEGAGAGQPSKWRKVTPAIQMWCRPTPRGIRASSTFQHACTSADPSTITNASGGSPTTTRPARVG